MNAIAAALSGRVRRFPVPNAAHLVGVAWLAALLCVVAWQFHGGFVYKSNETTNIYLRLARGAAFAMLPLLVILWLPVMRNTITAIASSFAGSWLPLQALRSVHRWLGHAIFALSLLHGSQYLIYYATLDEPFAEVLFGLQPDLVRSMRTNMYDFVTDDESIDAVHRWIEAGASRETYERDIRPVMQKDCTKCHNSTATRSYARTDMPMSGYEDVVSWTKSGMASRQFRINISGMLIAGIVLAMWMTALGLVRRHRFNAFQHVHRLGYLMAALGLLHIPSLQWVVGPTVILAAELYVSRHRRLYRDLPARAEPWGDQVVRLAMDRPLNLANAGGHYVQIRIRDFARQEWHAFSLTGAGDDDSRIILKIRCVGDWTRRLLSAAEQGKPLTVDVRGPFASPAAAAIHHRNWLLVAGGIGVTPFLSLLRMVATASDHARHVHLVWVVRAPALLRWLEPLMERFADHLHVSVHWHIFVDDEAWAGRLPTLSAGPGHEVEVRSGRPDWDGLFAAIAFDHPRLTCFTCGPRPMIDEVSRRCRSYGWSVNQENFG